MLEFYTSPTPNGWKVAMTLEEMGLDYRLRTVNLSAGEQQEESYLNINPNGRIPAIVDDGFAVFEVEEGHASRDRLLCGTCRPRL